MIHIAILSHVGIETGGQNFLYPLFRWKTLLKQAGIQYRIFRDHRDPALANYPIVVVIHRYFHQLLGDTNLRDKSVIVDFLGHLKNKGCTVIYFDAGDSSGSRDFDLMPYVDRFWKKQVLRDRRQYTCNEGERSVRVWIPETDEGKDTYQPCAPEYLPKIHAAWHIGLSDYRNWHGRLGHITNRIHSTPGHAVPSAQRPYSTVFRGTMGKNPVYAWQRNEMLRQLNTWATSNAIVGGKVKKPQYLREIRQARILFSPFGWGEICYRDFEAFLSGCVLLKPSVEHLEGYPDIFVPGETYVPLQWSLEDMREQFFEVDSNYARYVEMAHLAQQRYLRVIQDGEGFVRQFSQSIHLKSIE